MKTASDHLRKHPRALPSTLAYIDKRKAVVEQLQREMAPKPAAGPSTRKSILDRLKPWFGRRA